MSTNLIKDRDAKSTNLIDSLKHLSEQRKENSVGDKLAPEFDDIQSLKTIETFMNYSLDHILLISIGLIIFLTIIFFLYFLLRKYQHSK